jgi:recombinational DNA repair protein (RecF pathway)
MFRTRTRAEARSTPADSAPDVYPAEAVEKELADHGLHIESQTCARCGREITPNQDARRTAKGECVHLNC